MAKQHLLIVDSDPKSLRVLEVSLKKAGFSITRAANGVDALEKIRISAPDMIITETLMPEMDGFELIERLKEKPEWADIPVMFLTARKSIEDKIRGLEQGVEDYLTKPIFIREILARVSLVMQRRQRERLETRGSKTEFSGNLQDMGIVDLIQTIDISQKSGVISVERDAERGEIFFKNGKVIDAETRSRRGDEAVYRMLVWSEGTFRIEFKAVNREDHITLSTQGLLMEGMRRLDEWGRLQEQLPPLTSIFDIDDELLAERLGEIPDEINSLLKHFNGERTLMEVVDLCPLGDLEALTIITKLYFEGLICDMGVVGSHEAGDDLLDGHPDGDMLTTDGHGESHAEEPDSWQPTHPTEGTRSVVPPPATPSRTADGPSIMETIRMKPSAPPREAEHRPALQSSFVSALSRTSVAPPPPDNDDAGDDSLTSTGSYAVPQEAARNLSEDTAAAKGGNRMDTLSPVKRDAAAAAAVIGQVKLTSAGRTTNPPPGVKPAPATALPRPLSMSETKTMLHGPAVVPVPVSAPVPVPVAAPVPELEPAPSKEVPPPKEPAPPEKTPAPEPAAPEPAPTPPPAGDAAAPVVEPDEARVLPVPDDGEWDEPIVRPRRRGGWQIAAVAILVIGAGAAGFLLRDMDGVKDYDTAPVIRREPSKNTSETTPANTLEPAPPATDPAPTVETPVLPPVAAGDPVETPSAPVEPPPVALTAEQQAQYDQLLADAQKTPNRRQKMELLLNAVDIHPRGIEALTEFALMTMEAKKFQDQSLEFAERAVKLAPDNARAWLVIGWINQQRDAEDVARDAYRRCAEGQGPEEFVRNCRALLR